jgi:hypothetical protein
LAQDVEKRQGSIGQEKKSRAYKKTLRFLFG